MVGISEGKSHKGGFLRKHCLCVVLLRHFEELVYCTHRVVLWKHRGSHVMKKMEVC